MPHFNYVFTIPSKHTLYVCPYMHKHIHPIYTHLTISTYISTNAPQIHTPYPLPPPQVTHTSHILQPHITHSPSLSLSADIPSLFLSLNSCSYKANLRGWSRMWNFFRRPVITSFVVVLLCRQKPQSRLIHKTCTAGG